MNQFLVLIGIVLIFIGILAIFLGSFAGKEGKVEWGIGGFIGPVPVGFASSKPMMYIIIALLAILALLHILLGLR